jgi:hypothetical protein
MCVYGHLSKKYRVGRSALNFIYFLLSAKPEIVVPESDSGISFSKYPIGRHLSAHVDQHGLQGIVTVSYKTYRDTYRNTYRLWKKCIVTPLQRR